MCSQSTALLRCTPLPSYKNSWDLQTCLLGFLIILQCKYDASRLALVFLARP